MSDAPQIELSPRLRWFSPWFFVAGLVMGLGVLSWLGFKSGRTDYHPGFVRFFPAISLETNYYPTLNEMTAIVRSQCRPDQVLVIVGGNSILQGVWQPVSDLWSKHLQELLGDRYVVINLAFRGGSPTDGGAVVAEVLRKEYPRQVYIADEAPFVGIEPIAHEPYRYIFWQAYFRGLLIDTPARKRRVSELRSTSGERRVVHEEAIKVWLDSAFHYNDLWNRVCFEKFCTVPSYLGDYVPAMLRPRRVFQDDEPDAYNPVSMAAKYPVSGLETEMKITRNATVLYYSKPEGGAWELSNAKLEEMAANYREAFPEELKPRTLILVGRGSPYYHRRLTEDEQARDDQGYKDAVAIWKDAGCVAMDYGQGFSDDDYGDRSHLSKTGGRKLAEAVAPQVQAIAEKLSYLKNDKR